MVREITSAAEFANAKNVPNLVVVDYYATYVCAIFSNQYH